MRINKYWNRFKWLFYSKKKQDRISESKYYWKTWTTEDDEGNVNIHWELREK